MKQRIVGALVLIAVAAVIVPIVFDLRHDNAALERPVDIPPKPKGFTVRVLPLIHPDKEAADEQAAAAADAAAPPAATATMTTAAGPAASPAAPPQPAPGVQAPPPPPAAAAGEPQGWAVQVGSFTSEDHAVALRDRLRKRRYTAFVEKVTLASGQNSYRVQVGPELLRSDAEKLQVRLKQDTKLPGLVVSR